MAQEVEKDKQGVGVLCDNFGYDYSVHRRCISGLWVHHQTKSH